MEHLEKLALLTSLPPCLELSQPDSLQVACMGPACNQGLIWLVWVLVLLSKIIKRIQAHDWFAQEGWKEMFVVWSVPLPQLSVGF